MSPAVSRSDRTARCSSAIDPARSSASKRTGGHGVLATLPPSVAAFHLAFGPDGYLYVTAPTLGTHDAVYRITPDGEVSPFCAGFGRPQGLAFDAAGHLYVVDALAGCERPVSHPAQRAGVARAGALGRAAHRPRVRSARRARARGERNGLRPRCRCAGCCRSRLRRSSAVIHVIRGYNRPPMNQLFRTQADRRAADRRGPTRSSA